MYFSGFLLFYNLYDKIRKTKKYFSISPMFSPSKIYHFITSERFRRFTATPFSKSNLQKRVPGSLFSEPDDIYFIESLIEKNYITQKTIENNGETSNIYEITIFGAAFIHMYRHSFAFRAKSFYLYYKLIFWVVIASGVGSIIANFLTTPFLT